LLPISLIAAYLTGRDDTKRTEIPNLSLGTSECGISSFPTDETGKRCLQKAEGECTLWPEYFLLEEDPTHDHSLRSASRVLLDESLGRNAPTENGLPMPDRHTFRTRARAIDHLGRGQIADCPTAVSELWKNSFDAYATEVSLHLFDGEPTVGAVFDNGCGMTADDLITNWLVVGTESKVESPKVPLRDRFGLSERPRLGEKGIGRLSAAFLAPITLVVSKKKTADFAAVMVDWRLFENPFLSIDDITIPVETFADAEELFELIPSMSAVLQGNLDGKGLPVKRSNEVRQAWASFSKQERSAAHSPTTQQQIAKGAEHALLEERHLAEWDVFAGNSDHGTAFFVIDLNHELGIWVDSSIHRHNEEADGVRQSLKSTLTAFTAPDADFTEAFSYAFFVHQETNTEEVLSSTNEFGDDELSLLEHYIRGKFNEQGYFHGTVRAFGKDLGHFSVAPKVPGLRDAHANNRIGPFEVRIGTFEQDRKATTHSPEEYEALRAKAESYSGLKVYRDGLRVLPYGRPDSDFFEMEERRSMHAGREFWAHRRTFGRVSLTRAGNPNLRDKAGREGLVDNEAKRKMQLLVINVLRDTAHRYFGTGSEPRADHKAEQTRRAGKEAQERARRLRRTEFRSALRRNEDPLQRTLELAKPLENEIESATRQGSQDVLLRVQETVSELQVRLDDLRLPPVPANLGDYEERYRDYRDGFEDLCSIVARANKKVAESLQKVVKKTPRQIAEEYLESYTKRLSEKLDRYVSSGSEILGELRAGWSSQTEQDKAQFVERGKELLKDLVRGSRLSAVLSSLDALFAESDDAVSLRYEAAIRALRQLVDNIDLDSALSVTEDERLELEKNLREFYGLAQLGIAIEMIGHELEAMQETVNKNLKRLPTDVRSSRTYERAYESFRALVDRLRFLAPMKMAGYRSRQEITGESIAGYVQSFFGKRLDDCRTSLSATGAFRSISVTDLPSRIYPVFINLVNNSLYWLQFVSNRRIVFDYQDGKVIVADSGQGVDKDDIKHLFQLFFTRRANGRGVGLYLCRTNLAVGHHTIRYAEKSDPKVLEGANFIIEFRDLEHA